MPDKFSMPPLTIEPTALPGLNATCTAAPASGTAALAGFGHQQPLWGGDEDRLNAIQNVKMAALIRLPGTRNTSSRPTPEIACLSGCGSRVTPVVGDTLRR